MNSMTGYASLQQEHSAQQFSLELRSVNNRYLDINIRMPHFLLPYEAEMKGMISKIISRGKLDLYVDIKNRKQEATVYVDEKLACQYAEAFERIKKKAAPDSVVPVASILAADGVVSVREYVDASKIWDVVKKMLRQVIANFNKMRQVEGRATAVDMKSVITGMKKSVAFINTKTKDAVAKQFVELKERISKLLEGNVDEKMLLSEAGMLASKSDINEELARLKSHFAMFEKMVKEKKPVGKSLDFVCQEMNREINTIGSKQNSFEISEKVIQLKSGVEKLREQVRNVE